LKIRPEIGWFKTIRIPEKYVQFSNGIKNGPFHFRKQIAHFKTGLVWYLDSHCSDERSEFKNRFVDQSKDSPTKFGNFLLAKLKNNISSTTQLD
jgi:hypothetical protein